MSLTPRLGQGAQSHESVQIATVLRDRQHLSDRFREWRRHKLAAKTVKDVGATSTFQRECLIWLTLNEPGVVPLLKVVQVDDAIFALMPRYSGNLRDVLVAGTGSKAIRLIKMLELPIKGLFALNRRTGVVHQDIKPENILYRSTSNGISFDLSDWGMANVQASSLRSGDRALNPFMITTMGGWGTIPYMAPERFASYATDVRADIFSLGVVFFEIIVGARPFEVGRSVADQIIGGEFYLYAKAVLV